MEIQWELVIVFGMTMMISMNFHMKQTKLYEVRKQIGDWSDK